MEAKSRLPTKIKMPATRSNVPSDRVNGAANGPAKPSQSLGGGKTLPSSRAVLTQNFENICNQLKNGTGPVKRPMKRHASPEFRTASVAQKRLRRSRSVSDMESLLKQGHRARADVFALPSGPAPKAKLVSKVMPPVRRPLVSVKKVVEPPKPRGGAVGKAMHMTEKKKLAASGGGVAKPPTSTAPKARIPPYDFKARFQDLTEKHDALKEKHNDLKSKFGDYASLPDKYDECQKKLANLESEYQEVKEQLNGLEKQTASDALQIKTLSDDLDAKIEECRGLIETRDKMGAELTVVKGENVDLKETKIKLESEMYEYRTTTTKTIDDLMAELEAAKEQLYRANLDRKELHNTIMDLRGNIRVFCRVRPPLDNEGERALCSYNYADETALEICK